MKILVAIDSMKGCLTSAEANQAVRQGILRRLPDAEVECVAMSDGGEGFLDAVAPLLDWQNGEGSARWIEAEVRDPLMRRVRARYLIYKDTAYIEMAEASGLGLLRPEERNPLTATTYGTGQLIADAVRHGAREIVVGLGGSATNDCGQGMLQALEDELADDGWSGRGVEALRRKVHFTIATDVVNPLLGSQGAARVFAAQKTDPSLSPEARETVLVQLEARAAAFASACARQHGHDHSLSPGAGTAGGLGYAFLQFFDARRVSGIDFLLDAHRFDQRLAEAALVITGEGRADRQTLMGKVPMGILRRAQARDIPTWLVAGQVADPERLKRAGFARVMCITPQGMPLSEAMNPCVAKNNLANCLAESLEIINFEQ